MQTINQTKVLHLDTNHPLLWNQLQEAGFINESDFTSTKTQIESIIHQYHGIVIRSRFKIDKTFIDKATNLQFIARVGAGLESIDCDYATQKNIQLIASPEGNANAVGEHALGLLLMLFNKLNTANNQVKLGQWNRESNRGHEIEGKTIGIIGYGNMGKSFAKKLSGFNCTIIFHDILPNLSNENATQVSLQELQQKADILSLHTPFTPQTNQMVNEQFIANMAKPFWLINTARGACVNTQQVVNAMQNGKILGVGLDVLEYEKLSFENLNPTEIPEALTYLCNAENAVLTPHIAGWTHESKIKLAQVIVDKIKNKYQK